MKLVRPISAISLLFPLSVAMFALQYGGGQRFGGRQQYSYGPNVPSELYWSRLQYNSGYASGSSFGFRGFRFVHLAAGKSILDRSKS